MRKFVSLAAVALLAFGVTALAGDESKKKALKVGDAAPAFTLRDLDGKEVSLAKVLEQKKIVVLEWFNPGCPFVKKHHLHNSTMRDLATKYKDKVVWLAINSSAKGKQGHGVDLNKESKKNWKIPYPILLDADGKTGRAYGAKRTPHMYVIDAQGKLAYMGAIDDDNSARKAGKVNYVEAAIEALLSGKAPAKGKTKSYGCSVKYAPRN